MTHPLDEKTPCVLSKKIEIPAGRKSVLKLQVSHHEGGDWLLMVKADGQTLYEKTISEDTMEDGWQNVEVDLSELAGKSVDLEVLNGKDDDWCFEAAYWGEITVESN
jgi:hypothetical protein